MTKRPLLTIVQNKPTQFDAPLYRRMRRDASFDLRVYYTEAAAHASVGIDDELGVAPQWDHVADEVDAPDWLSYVPNEPAVRLAAKVEAEHPGLVIVCGYYPPVHARLTLALKAKGLRVGLRSDNTLRHSRFIGGRGLVKRIVLPAALRLYDSWHPVGSLARRYLETVGRDSRPTFLFPYNVDNDWFEERSTEARSAPDGARAAIGLDPSDLVVLGVVKWHEREDPLTLVDGFLRFCEREPSARLLLVGDGPLRDEVRARLALASDRVRLPGYVAYSALPRYYAAADVFVHPAAGEPWGVSVNEAMACGVPVVAAEGVGAGADLIVEGETGRVFADRDPDALARVLAELSVVQLRGMGDAARRRMRAWSYQQTAIDMARALDSALARGRR